MFVFKDYMEKKRFPVLTSPRSQTMNLISLLINEQDCFILNTRRSKRFISDKEHSASLLNGFKNDPFCTHLTKLFMEINSKKMLYKTRK